MRRTGKAIGTLAAATSLAMVGGGLALADSVTITSDAITVAKGTTGTFTVYLVATGNAAGDSVGGCNANNSNPVTLSFTSSNTAVAAAPASVTVSGCDDPATTTIIEHSRTVNVPVLGTAVDLASTVIRASGAGGRTTGNPATAGSFDDDSITVNVAASNTAPTAPGPVTASASVSKTGTFTVNWGASTDTQSDAITYTLEAKDADDVAWTVLSSSLTNNSYAVENLDEGTWSYRVKARDASLSSGYTSAASLVKVDKGAPNAPAITSPSGGYAGSGNVTWYAANTTISVASAGDPALADGSAGSGVDLQSLPSGNEATATAGAVGSAVTVSGTAKDVATNESSASGRTIRVDKQAPAISCPSKTVSLGSTSSAAWTASDGNGSGVASGASGTEPLDTTNVGAGQTVTVAAASAVDNVGNTSAAATCTYNVVYDVDAALGQPINPDGSSAFTQKRTVPVKIGLAGDSGPGYSTSAWSIKRTVVACEGGAGAAGLEDVASTTSSSSFRYDSIADQYIFNASLSGTTVGSCYKFVVSLGDGATHSSPMFKVAR